MYNFPDIFISYSNEGYNPDMIKLGREARGLTQRELCERTNIAQGTVSKIENRMLSFDQQTAERISEALDYPLGFFEQKNPLFPYSVIYFRRNQSLPVKIVQMIEARMNIVRINVERLIDNVESPEVNLIPWDVEKNGDPERAAQTLREFWRVPKGPIQKLIKLIEDHGIIVVSFDFGTDKVDGLSMYTTSRVPIICFNSCLKGDRRRLTIAHELGHIVMHYGQVLIETYDVESEAYRFATEFLVPESEFRKSFTRLDLPTLAGMKRYWQVSMRALIYKAQHRKIITENQAKYLWKQMTANGYVKSEPPALDVVPEEPSLLREIIEVHQNELGYSCEEIARLVSLTKEEFARNYLGERRTTFQIIRNDNPPPSSKGDSGNIFKR
jgi:Zn-dependent peptidase ImmA (M78 family)/DNA-binding XRE family transcriptional regulator